MYLANYCIKRHKFTFTCINKKLKTISLDKETTSALKCLLGIGGGESHKAVLKKQTKTTTESSKNTLSSSAKLADPVSKNPTPTVSRERVFSNKDVAGAKRHPPSLTSVSASPMCQDQITTNRLLLNQVRLD